MFLVKNRNATRVLQIGYQGITCKVPGFMQNNSRVISVRWYCMVLLVVWKFTVSNTAYRILPVMVCHIAVLCSNPIIHQLLTSCHILHPDLQLYFPVFPINQIYLSFFLYFWPATSSSFNSAYFSVCGMLDVLKFRVPYMSWYAEKSIWSQQASIQCTSSAWSSSAS